MRKSLILGFIIILTVDCLSHCGFYLGCFRDDPISRDLTELKTIALLTVDNCVSSCAYHKYAYAGLQYSSECFCGNSFGRYGQLDEHECNFKCLGNSSQVCGGSLSNSVYAIRRVFDFETSTTTITSPLESHLKLNGNATTITTSIPITTIQVLPNWSIYYPSSFFANPNLPVVRLMEIVSAPPLSPLNLYSRLDYFRSQSRLEVTTLSGSISNKKSINLNLSLDNTTSLVVVWHTPQLSLFLNCQLAIKIEFIKSTELEVLSLPYYQASSLKSFGGRVHQSQVAAFRQADCLLVSSDSSTSSSSSSLSSTSSSRSIDTSTSVMSSAAVNITSASSLKNSEWGILLNSNVLADALTSLSSSSASAAIPLRLFDLADDRVYASANYFPANQTLEVSMLVDSSLFTRRVLKINSTLALADINTILVAWRTPMLYVFVNCELVGEIGFTDVGQQAVMSMPYFKSNALLGSTSSGKFFDTIQDLFLNSGGCVQPEFLLTSSNSNESTILKAFSNSEWSIYFSNALFTNPGKFVRLLEISSKHAVTGSNNVLVDYFPSDSSVQVSMRLKGVIQTKKETSRNNSSGDDSSSISTLLLSWKYPYLVVTINCVERVHFEFKSASESRVLGTPYFAPESASTPGYFSGSIEKTFKEAGCLTTSGNNLRTADQTIPIIVSTITTATTNTYTPTLSSLSSNRLASPSVKSFSYAYNNNDYDSNSPLPVKSSSITTIPDGDNTNFNNLDSNFILTVYNTRILQYQNLVKLQQILRDYNLIDVMAYNLTFFDC